MFRATVLAHEKWPIRASLRPLDIYIYVFGSQSCATRLIFVGSARLWPETKPRMAPLVEFGAVLGASDSHTSSDRLRRLGLRPRVIPRSLRRRSRRLRGDTRRNASSADTPPRLATCLTTHPTNRVAACRSVRHSPPRPLPHLPIGAFFFVASAAARQICRAALTSPHDFPAANPPRCFNFPAIRY